jgi:putative endonuclease
MTTIEVGARSEAIAVERLRAEGYAIVERNFRVKRAEVDVVAIDPEGVLCFVEVRSRADDRFGNAAESVNHKKRAKVTRGALAYLTMRRPVFVEARFDVVAITGEQVDLVRDAWRLDREL